jgi:hypothetical protein
MAMDIGPVELVVLVFPGGRADPGTVEVLSEVVSQGHVTVLDLVFVTRTPDGFIRVADAHESLAGIGRGSFQLKGQALISEEDLDVVRDTIEPGSSAAVIAYEHSWARRLAATAGKAGGAVVLHVQVPRDAVEAAVAAAGGTG